MIYAPIAICTLNRYEHFIRCIESLERNPWAKYTEIFISIDYPPDDKYRAGYEKIVEYLNQHELKFKKSNLFYQKENLGVNENFEQLTKIVYEKYDRLLLFEDDIEVSPNYLEYMNKALEYGKTDDRVFCVCPFLEPIKKPRKITGTVFLAQTITSASGVYRDKQLQKDRIFSKQWVDSIVRDRKAMIKFFFRCRRSFYYFLIGYIVQHQPAYFNKKGEIVCIDTLYALYMTVFDMYAIVPAISKARNWGYDGTGQNCKMDEDKDGNKQEIDAEKNFDFRLETNKRINRIFQYRYSKREVEKNLDVWKGLAYYLYMSMTHKL